MFSVKEIILPLDKKILIIPGGSSDPFLESFRLQNASEVRWHEKYLSLV